MTDTIKTQPLLSGRTSAATAPLGEQPQEASLSTLKITKRLRVVGVQVESWDSQIGDFLIHHLCREEVGMDGQATFEGFISSAEIVDSKVNSSCFEM